MAVVVLYIFAGACLCTQGAILTFICYDMYQAVGADVTHLMVTLVITLVCLVLGVTTLKYGIKYAGELVDKRVVTSLSK